LAHGIKYDLSEKKNSIYHTPLLFPLQDFFRCEAFVRVEKSCQNYPTYPSTTNLNLDLRKREKFHFIQFCSTNLIENKSNGTFGGLKEHCVLRILNF
jgi:hypothetical protein